MMEVSDLTMLKQWGQVRDDMKNGIKSSIAAKLFSDLGRQ